MAVKVELREVRDADIPIFFEQQFDPEAAAMAVFPSRGPEAHFAHWAKVRADRSAIVRTVLADGEVAGNIASYEAGGERLVGYWIGKRFWGRGVATEALTALLLVDAARPLLAHVAVRHAASIRVLEKCGFVVVREEKAVSRGGGEAVDELVFALES